MVSSTKSGDGPAALAAGSFDAWSNANVDQEHSKLSSKQQAIAGEPSLARAAQRRMGDFDPQERAKVL